jgi:hypothetical protein
VDAQDMRRLLSTTGVLLRATKRRKHWSEYGQTVRGQRWWM